MFIGMETLSRMNMNGTSTEEVGVVKRFKFIVTEVVKKSVEVECDDYETAESIALEEDMDKNFDYYDKFATLIEDGKEMG